MASSFRSILEGLANSGKNAQLQKQIGQLVRSGAIDKRQATNLFGELVPIATKNQKPPEPLSNSELADLRTRFANLEGGISATLVSRAINNGQISNDEAMEYNRRINEIRGRGASKAPSTTNKSVTSSQSGSSAPSSQSGSSAPSSQSGSEAALNKFKLKTGVQSANKTIAALERSKITSEPFKAINRPETKPEPFTPINRPETKPEPFTDNPSTDNVTKPDTGGAVRPLGPNATKSEKKIAALENDPDFQKLNKQQQNDIRFGIVQEKFGPKFDRGQFNFLLDRLTGSKIRQNRDAQAQERQNIYSRGLSSMFANF